MLCGLSLRFMEGNRDYVIDHNDYEFFFSEEQFLKLISNINIRKYKQCNIKSVYDSTLYVKDHASEKFKQIRDHYQITNIELEQ